MLDDATQEVFWVAARRLGDIQPGSEAAFLYGVALRIASNIHRRQKAQLQTADLEDLATLRKRFPPIGGTFRCVTVFQWGECFWG